LNISYPDFSEDSTTPYFTIESPNPIVTLEFNHRDAQCLAGGLMSGQVAFWDIRKSSNNVAISNIRDGHRDPVRSLHWIHSKTSTEFYTGSSDGQVMFSIIFCDDAAVIWPFKNRKRIHLIYYIVPVFPNYVWKSLFKWSCECGYFVTELICVNTNGIFNIQ